MERKFVKTKINDFLKESLINNNGDLEDLSQDDINEILRGYIECAIWTEEERLNDNNIDDEDVDDMDEIEKIIKMKNNFNTKNIKEFINDFIDDNSKIEAYLDIKKFIQTAGDVAIQEAIDENGLFQLGMEIWLTRNGHGAGFFDHNYENEEVLTSSAKKLKSKDLYIGDD